MSTKIQKEVKEYSAVYEELNKIKKGSKEKVQKKKNLEELILAKMQSDKIRELRYGLVTFSIKACKKNKQLTKDKICELINNYINESNEKVTAEDLSNYIWSHRESTMEDKLKYNKPKSSPEQKKNKKDDEGEEEEEGEENDEEKRDSNDKEEAEEAEEDGDK
jgi:hypothetical protein